MEKILGAITVPMPGIEFATCTNCSAALVRTSGPWALTIPPSEPLNEAYSRLMSVLSVCEHELAAIRMIADNRLELIIGRMEAFRLDLIAAMRGLEQPDDR